MAIITGNYPQPGR